MSKLSKIKARLTVWYWKKRLKIGTRFVKLSKGAKQTAKNSEITISIIKGISSEFITKKGIRN